MYAGLGTEKKTMKLSARQRKTRMQGNTVSHRYRRRRKRRRKKERIRDSERRKMDEERKTNRFNRLPALRERQTGLTDSQL